MCTFVIAQLTTMRKVRPSTDDVTVPCLAFHWVQYMCSMIHFLFVQFCVSEPTQA